MNILKETFVLPTKPDTYRPFAWPISFSNYVVFSFLISWFLACEKQTTPIEITTISLIAEYVGVTEVELLLVTDLEELPYQYRLLRNGESVLSGELIGSHTTLWDTTLQPARSYTYQVKLLQQNVVRLLSNELTLTTMDTTSHDFQWEIIEIPSPFGSGVLRDVAIINENDIWTVGEIYADSAQPWLPYNAVHWDGQQWELKRIPFTGWCSAVQYPPIRSVFAFSDNDIWFARGGSLVHWNGNSFYNDCDMNALLEGSINRLWGIDSNALYAVGGAGSIVYYDGSSWQKLQSGTALSINDIWGSPINKTGKMEILSIASNQFINQGKKLLKIENNRIIQLPDNGLSWALNTVWHVSGKRYFIGGDGFYESRKIGPVWHRKEPFTPYYITSVRGTDVNDIFLTGAAGLLMHFNGISWRNYQDITGMSSGSFARVDVEENTVVAIGSISAGGIQRNGVVFMGKR